MKNLHALWSQWTHPGSPGPDAPADWASRQATAWQAWLDAGRHWWTWWAAAAATPWLRQPWPHAGQVEELPAAAPVNPAKAMAPPAVPARQAPPQRAEHKSRHLQRRKINPG